MDQATQTFYAIKNEEAYRATIRARYTLWLSLQPDCEINEGRSVDNWQPEFNEVQS